MTDKYLAYLNMLSQRNMVIVTLAVSALIISIVWRLLPRLVADPVQRAQVQEGVLLGVVIVDVIAVILLATMQVGDL